MCVSLSVSAFVPRAKNKGPKRETTLLIGSCAEEKRELPEQENNQQNCLLQCGQAGDNEEVQV